MVGLKQLTAELVVEAAVKCLRVIQPSLSLPHSLPPSMSARYKIGADIAEACIVSTYLNILSKFLYCN